MAHFPLPFVTLVTRSRREILDTTYIPRRPDARSRAPRAPLAACALSQRRSIRCGTTKIPPPPSRYRTILRFDKALHGNSPGPLSTAPSSAPHPSYVPSGGRVGEGKRAKRQKVRWLKSEPRTSSILKSETKSTRLPTYLENVHLLSRLPSASTNHDSIFDLAKISTRSRLSQRYSG